MKGATTALADVVARPRSGITTGLSGGFGTSRSCFGGCGAATSEPRVAAALIGFTGDFFRTSVLALIGRAGAGLGLAAFFFGRAGAPKAGRARSKASRAGRSVMP
ncbi:MAG: hypothetical protein M0D55_08295 [Elusimicrobiota bacterium]|nr:MAG: hypothetical protein M0D55_08295 [Elusimicrobiota bacterium]